MIQDILPHRYHNEYRPVPPTPQSVILYYQDHQVLACVQGNEIAYPKFLDLQDENPDLYENAQFLFSIDEVNYYLPRELYWPEEGRFRLTGTDLFRSISPRHLAFAGVTGMQLAHWYHSRRFCGICGGRTQHSSKERMLYCPLCRTAEYPKLCPAVIVGITKGNQILLSRYADSRGSKTRYALIAGYAEIGETIEETVKREVMEEVGLRVTNLRYYKSQPWSFSDTLLFGFYCDVDGGDKITVDQTELSFADWYERDAIPVKPSYDSLTNEMILAFKNGIV